MWAGLCFGLLAPLLFDVLVLATDVVPEQPVLLTWTGPILCYYWPWIGEPGDPPCVPRTAGLIVAEVVVFWSFLAYIRSDEQSAPDYFARFIMTFLALRIMLALISYPVLGVLQILVHGPA